MITGEWEMITGEWENCMLRSFKICTPHQTLFRYHIKENKTGGICGMYREEEKRIQGLGWANIKDREHLENKNKSTSEGNIKWILNL